jgi:hypothetical protein
MLLPTRPTEDNPTQKIVGANPLCRRRAHSVATQCAPASRGWGVSAVALGADDATDPVRAPRSAQCEAGGGGDKMPARQRMQGRADGRVLLLDARVTSPCRP